MEQVITTAAAQEATIDVTQKNIGNNIETGLVTNTDNNT